MFGRGEFGNYMPLKSQSISILYVFLMIRINTAVLHIGHVKETCSFLVSQTRTNFRDRAFCAAGPRVWNYLPTDLRQPDLSYSCWRHFYLVIATKAQCDSPISPFNCTLDVMLLSQVCCSTAGCGSRHRRCTSARQWRARRLQPTWSFTWTSITRSWRRFRWQLLRRQVRCSSRDSSLNAFKSVPLTLCLDICI